MIQLCMLLKYVISNGKCLHLPDFAFPLLLALLLLISLGEFYDMREGKKFEELKSCLSFEKRLL